MVCVVSGRQGGGVEAMRAQTDEMGATVARSEGETSAGCRRVGGGAHGAAAPVDAWWCGQAQPPPTMDISWQGRYTDNLHAVTSSASSIL